MENELNFCFVLIVALFSITQFIREMRDNTGGIFALAWSLAVAFSVMNLVRQIFFTGDLL